MATLTSYLTDVRRLLHDSTGAFWSDAELTDHINAARKRTVRDTGCLRTLQRTAVPLSSTGVVALPWSASLAVTAGQFIFSNIFTYAVTVSGNLDASTPPPYPTGAAPFPPTTPFANGTATLQYDSPAEIINLAALPQGISTFDVLNVNLFWGNTRVPLEYRAWTQFNAMLRYWQNYIGRPVCFTTYGQGQLYIGPVPDQSYFIEIDSVAFPADLTLASPSTVDAVVDPYTTPVPFYAAYKAKYTEQSFGEAEVFQQEYKKQALSALASVFTRRIPNAWGQGGTY